VKTLDIHVREAHDWRGPHGARWEFTLFQASDGRRGAFLACIPKRRRSTP
jgi:hypothetical protein